MTHKHTHTHTYALEIEMLRNATLHFLTVAEKQYATSVCVCVSMN